MGLFKHGDKLLINGQLYILKRSHSCIECPLQTRFNCTNEMKKLLGVPKNKYKGCYEMFSGCVPHQVKNKIDKWKYISGR